MRMWSGKTAGVFTIAILAGLALGDVNLPNDDVQAPLVILLFTTFLLGLRAPRGAWRWAVIVGLAVPISLLLSLKQESGETGTPVAATFPRASSAATSTSRRRSQSRRQFPPRGRTRLLVHRVELGEQLTRLLQRPLPVVLPGSSAEPADCQAHHLL